MLVLKRETVRLVHLKPRALKTMAMITHYFPSAAGDHWTALGRQKGLLRLRYAKSEEAPEAFRGAAGIAELPQRREDSDVACSDIEVVSTCGSAVEGCTV